MDLYRLGLVSTRLEYFQAVVTHGSIRRAAQFLNVAPSVISRSLRQLEEDLGAPLFERVRQRLHLTSAGETLAYHAHASSRALNQACAFIDDLQGLRRGRVSVVAVESAMRGLLPDVLSTFWERHPNVSVSLRTAGSREALEAVAAGDCDLAIAFDVRVPRNARRLAAATTHVGALLRPDHPKAGDASVRLRDFTDQHVLLADVQLTLGRLIDELAADEGIAFQVRARTNSIDELVAFAVRGHGISFQTRLGVTPELRRGELVFVPLQDSRLKPRRLILAAAGQGRQPEAPAALAALLSDSVEALH
ncbi:MAG: LysR family transcriptional regulator, partial [Moraxellaceae bacterium]|nr:LysR family transcriptional regulator [Moraxellaceae bacterium]